MNQDLEDKSVGELNEIIIELKTKHYFGGGLTSIERKRYRMAKALFRQKLQNLPYVTPVGSSCDINI
jgi:hypothetical protein